MCMFLFCRGPEFWDEELSQGIGEAADVSAAGMVKIPLCFVTNSIDLSPSLPWLRIGVCSRVCHVGDGEWRGGVHGGQDGCAGVMV